MDENDGAMLAEIGPTLLVRLSAMLRTARTYDSTNQAFQRQLHDCLALVLRGLEEENELALVSAADYFYLNGVRIKAQATLLGVYHSLLSEFERRTLGAIRFLQGVSPAEFERFIQLFMAAEDPALAERLPETVAEASIEHIVAVRAVQLEEEDVSQALDERRNDPAAERHRAKRVFWRAVLGTKKVLLRAKQTGRPDLRHAKRLVQPVVDSIMNHEYSIVGLTALKDHDEYTYAHCVNVSVLSIGIGQALGLPRQALADVGVAGLVHDIGKMAVPAEVLRKPAALSAEEWGMVRRHPIEGAKMMMRMPGLSGLMLDSMRVCLEHHMNYDRTGYPDVGGEWGQATLSRIVAVADCFDAITAHRAYSKRPYTSFEGLQYLLGPARVAFDPAVLWGLVMTIGLYPAGSVLVTESGYVLLAMSPNPNDVRRPNVRVLVNPDGRMESEENPQMWHPMPETEVVARALRPEEHAVSTGEMLAA
jgi:HD-GYP domain-containing protein (c-di-GMP phosphodiesterase class II)